MNSPILARNVGPRDAAAIAAIYAPHVLASTVSFETEPPDSEEICRRIDAIIKQGLPYLVAEIDGEVAGYAYAASFRPRPAYRFTVENSVYVAERFQRRGVAVLLMRRLMESCARLGMRKMVAVIADPTVNSASVGLHRSLGFDEAGLLRGVGVKFGRPIDVLLMQKSLG